LTTEQQRIAFLLETEAEWLGAQAITTDLDYVETATVIQRLNDVLEGRWSFVIIEYQILDDEVIVRGEMRIDDSVRQQFGGSSITRKNGSGELINLAEDLKSATADCLKKCASAFGVGRYLYGGKITDNDHATQQPRSNGNGNGNGRITNETIARIFSVSKSAGLSQSEVIKLASQLFKKPLSQLSNQEANELMNQFAVHQN